MAIDCIIVEDEPLAMERIAGYIKKLPLLQLKATFDNATDAFTFLQSHTPDIIFLDINLGELSGIQLLASMRIKSHVIITTAYPDFALQGYELNVTDYLLKPFSFERFLQAINKVQQATAAITTVAHDLFFVKTENRLEKIFFDEVLYIEGVRDYRKIHTLNKKIMTLETFAALEKEIPRAIICRVHKSYMVAISKIDAVERDRIYIQHEVIPVSATYKQQFLKIIGQ
jgi:DNA-binding LytR/AlgR family response regulator